MNQEEKEEEVINDNNDNNDNYKKKHFYNLSNDVIETNILIYIYPNELYKLCSISKLFNHIIVNLNWNDDYKMNKDIYYLIYDKFNTLPLKYIITKAWIETCKGQNINEKQDSKDNIIKWPLNNSCLKRKSGIYITGGAFQSKFTNETIFINHLDEITELETMPFSIGAMASIINNNNECLFLGGWLNHEETAINKIFSLNLDTVQNCWGMALDEDLPLNICYSAAINDINGNIFLLGGSDTPYRGSKVYKKCYMRPNQNIDISYSPTDDWLETNGIIHSALGKEMYFNHLCEKDNSELNNWIEIPSMNIKRCGHCAVQTFNENIVVLGGYKGGNDYLNSVEIFDKYTGIWTMLPNMNDNRSGLGSCISPNGSIYVYGGSPDGEQGLSSFERLDIREKKWFQLPTDSQNRGYTSMTIRANSQICVSGGLINLSKKNNVSISIYDIRAGKWYDNNDNNGLNYDKLDRNSHNCFYVL